MPQGWDPRKPVVVQKPAGARARVNLDPVALDRLILDQGIRVRVFRTSLCPNVKSIDSAEHNIDCKICNQTGFIDALPNDTWAFFQGIDFKKLPQEDGYYDGNTLSATFLAGIELQYYTLVELTDFTDIFFELIKRQEGPTDVLKYRARKVNMLVDQNGKQYLPTSDFVIDPNGSIQWIAGRSPLKGSIYSIHYEAAIQFRAMKAMHVHRFLQVSSRQKTVEMKKAQQQWMLQKEFLVERKDIAGKRLAPNKVRDSDED
jgi:hypothetical protein